MVNSINKFRFRSRPNVAMAILFAALAVGLGSVISPSNHVSAQLANPAYANQDLNVYPRNNANQNSQATFARQNAVASPFPRTTRTEPSSLRTQTNPVRSAARMVPPPRREIVAKSASVSLNSSDALARAFAGNREEKVLPKRQLQEIFAGYQSGSDDPASTNPFTPIPAQATPQLPTENQQTDGAPAQQPIQNPFGEIQRDGQPATQQDPVKNPFTELPADPNPITPPMDTRPVQPLLPPGSQFTPNPNQIPGVPPNPLQPGAEMLPLDPNPTQVPDRVVDPRVVNPPNTGPTPADPKTAPRETDLDPGTDPGTLSQIEEDQPDDVRAPPESIATDSGRRRYLPARDPVYYATPLKDRTDEQQKQQLGANPYANLPGPYGYAQPPHNMPQMPPPYAGYPGAYPPPYPPNAYAGGYPNPYLNPYGMPPNPYNACGPGCSPTNLCGQVSCCNSCCNSDRPKLARTISAFDSCNDCEVTEASIAETSIGERIVETGDLTDGNSYSEVVSPCITTPPFYVALFGGGTGISDMITRGQFGEGVYFEDAGYMFGIALGQIQGKNLRTEFEVSYRNINVNGLRLEGDVASQNVPVNGDFGTLSGMANAYWEFVDFGPEKIKPYIGGGVGFALARPDLLQSDGTEAVISDNESSFAWQWMAGLNYKASDSLDAFVEYRYFVADSFRLDTQIPEVANLGNGSGPFDYQSSNLLFGMRVRF